LKVFVMNKTANQLSHFYRLAFLLCYPLLVMAESDPARDYERARWHPLHFKPAIETAKNEQCLACHQAVLQPQVKAQSPAGIQSALAWYQTLAVYAGEQDTFHRQHLVTPLAKELMNLQCNTCHQGHDPREEAVIPPTTANAAFTLRKTVNPETTCLKCHGQFLPWHQIREFRDDNCLRCHATIRTTRHQVDYLNRETIEKAGQKNADACYGCHGGRSWYRISYPYPRHPWPGQSQYVPDWAKDRPTQ